MQLHGFTGSSAVFSRNVFQLSQRFHVVAPDLRGHGASDKPPAGYHVARLAMDLRNLIDHLGINDKLISAIGTSLGAAILWYVGHAVRSRRAVAETRVGHTLNCSPHQPLNR